MDKEQKLTEEQKEYLDQKRKDCGVEMHILPSNRGDLKISQQTVDKIMEEAMKDCRIKSMPNFYMPYSLNRLQTLLLSLVSEDEREVQMALVDKYPIKSKIVPPESTAGKWQTDTEIVLRVIEKYREELKHSGKTMAQGFNSINRLKMYLTQQDNGGLSKK